MILSISSIELRKRKARFDSKFLKIEKRYNKTDFSTIMIAYSFFLSYGTLIVHIGSKMAAQQ